MRLRRATIAAISAAVFSATGCNSDEREAVANAPTETFDPCSIPADAIAATGLNPEIFDNGWSDGINAGSWERCLWESNGSALPYFYEILASSKHDIADLDSNSQYSDLAEIEVEGHTWLKYRFTPVDQHIQCGVALDTVAGIVTAEVSLQNGPSLGQNPCQMVLDLTVELAGNLPAQK